MACLGEGGRNNRKEKTSLFNSRNQFQPRRDAEDADFDKDMEKSWQFNMNRFSIAFTTCSKEAHDSSTV